MTSLDVIGRSHRDAPVLRYDPNRDELAALLDGEPRYRLDQVWAGIHERGEEIDDLTNLPKALRARLTDELPLALTPEVESISDDGDTVKWLWRLYDGHKIETVLMHYDDRTTVCVSSQAGCAMACGFCATGQSGFDRHLSVGEIVEQIVRARRQSAPRRVSNIVFMGMGEPLYNFDEVKGALKIVMDGDGLALSKRRITLSTSGVVPMMARAGEEIGVNLAVSLHAVNKEIRDEIVPLNRKYGIEELLAACAAYPGANNARRITFEYVMLKDKNDSDADARELVRLIKQYRLPAKVNLIPFNPWPGAIYECSSPERVRAFSNIIFESGISAPMRTPRGRDIMAACGQLKSAATKPSRAELDRIAEEKQAALG